MKAKLPKDEPTTKFYDFTHFSVVHVLPGAVLTPREITGTRISSLRRRVSRRTRAASVWSISDRQYYIPFLVSVTPERPAKTEEETWATSARRARLSWMDENAY
jgi:hypothetical protein